MTDTVVRVFGSPLPNTLESQDLWRKLEACEDAAVLSLWREFGTLLLAEGQARAAALEGKANSLLAWSAAAAVAAVPLATSAVWILLTVVPAGIAAACGFMALRVSRTSVPSQLDWFDHVQSAEPARLQRFYLLAMRDWHSADAAANRGRGAWLTVGQYCLAAAVAVLFTTIGLGATVAAAGQ